MFGIIIVLSALTLCVFAPFASVFGIIIILYSPTRCFPPLISMFDIIIIVLNALTMCWLAWETGKTLKKWRYYCNQCFKSHTDLHGGPAAPLDASGGNASTVKMKKGERCRYCKKGTMTPDQITFTVWDFGGQEVFYPTHQLFLSSRSIYVVMFKLTKVNLDRLEYWLRHINSVSNTRPPTFIVGTHRDQLSDAQVTHQPRWCPADCARTCTCIHTCTRTRTRTHAHCQAETKFK